MRAGDRSAAGAALSEGFRLARRVGARPLQAAIDGLAARARLAIERRWNRPTRSTATARGAPRRPTPTDSASRLASGRCSSWSPGAGRTGRSPTPCSSARTPPASTSRTSWASSTRRPGRRPRRSRRGSASTRADRRLAPGPLRDAGEGALPVGRERCTGLVQIDRHGRVVGWDGRALARLTVDLGVDDALGQRRASPAAGRCASRSSCGTCRPGSPTTSSDRPRRGAPRYASIRPRSRRA